MFSATETAYSSLLQALTQGQADSIRKLKQMIKRHVSSKRYVDTPAFIRVTTLFSLTSLRLKLIYKIHGHDYICDFQ
jgi:hypothetical protein